MTPRGGPLSENGKLIAICILFPIFWPFLPVLLICMAIEKIRDVISDLYWNWRYRRSGEYEWDTENREWKSKSSHCDAG